MNPPNDSRDPAHDDGHVPPGDEVRAGEYVLGVLDAGERREAQARLASDPHFATLVDAWELRLAPWLSQVEPVAAPAQVWPRIRSELGWSSMHSVRPRLWNNAAFWRGTTAAALAAGIAAVVVGVRLLPAVAPPGSPTAVQAPSSTPINAKPVTVLARDDGSTGWLASIDTAEGTMQMLPVPGPAVPAGRTHELWIIAAGQSPVSLGAISNQTAATITVPARLREAFTAGSTLAITVEQQAGIPHAAPTGTIVASGTILKL